VSWTNPRTWVLGELITETLLNTHVRDNLLFLKANPVLSEQTTMSRFDVSGSDLVCLTLSSVAVGSDVGAVYVEAWGPALQGAAYLSDGTNYLSSAEGSGGGWYMRSRDLAWGGTTNTVTLHLVSTGAGAMYSTLAAWDFNSITPTVLRMVRSY
jgi:hypothetical protein